MLLTGPAQVQGACVHRCGTGRVQRDSHGLMPAIARLISRACGSKGKKRMLGFLYFILCFPDCFNLFFCHEIGFSKVIFSKGKLDEESYFSIAISWDWRERQQRDQQGKWLQSSHLLCFILSVYIYSSKTTLQRNNFATTLTDTLF